MESVKVDPVRSAQEADLIYISDDTPGLERRRRGKSFTYHTPEGEAVDDEATLERIRLLVIPPAWEEVWVCAIENGHLQATGRDARGRKQYRYHERWREVRDATKYDRLLQFGAVLPRIRRRITRDLKSPRLSRPRVLAGLVRILELTAIRIGNEEYVRANQSFGLTTLREQHVEIDGDTVRLHFHGKSGVEHSLELTDAGVAELVRGCQALPGETLFKYVDEQGRPHAIDSADVNAYLQTISGGAFTAKDFRTWIGSVMAVKTLRTQQLASSVTQAKRVVTQMVKQVAHELGNTVAVCRKAYIHPTVIARFMDGSWYKVASGGVSKAVRGLRHAEQELLRWVKKADLARALKGKKSA